MKIKNETIKCKGIAGYKMSERLTRKEWKRRKRIKKVIGLSIAALVGVVMLALLLKQTRKTDAPGIKVALLTPNEYSRPQTPLKKIKGIVVHYTANPGTTGWENRNYFENLKDSHTTKVSSHFIIGLDGTIIQNIPLNEIAYASNERNADTISIECCHPKKNGKFTKKTYESLIKLTAWLAGEYNLKKKDIIRHYDVTGKNCPKYYVEHEEKWNQFKEDVFSYENKKEKK
ncbi:MAG: peptidoglycan recognition family protein [Acetivibrio sp.]